MPTGRLLAFEDWPQYHLAGSPTPSPLHYPAPPQWNSEEISQSSHTQQITIKHWQKSTSNQIRLFFWHRAAWDHNTYLITVRVYRVSLFIYFLFTLIFFSTHYSILALLSIVYCLLFVKIVRNEYNDKFLICVNVFGNKPTHGFWPTHGLIPAEYRWFTQRTLLLADTGVSSHTMKQLEPCMLRHVAIKGYVQHCDHDLARLQAERCNDS
jgi:hypothetical protein